MGEENEFLKWLPGVASTRIMRVVTAGVVKKIFFAPMLLPLWIVILIVGTRARGSYKTELLLTYFLWILIFPSLALLLRKHFVLNIDKFVYFNFL